MMRRRDGGGAVGVGVVGGEGEYDNKDTFHSGSVVQNSVATEVGYTNLALALFTK